MHASNQLQVPPLESPGHQQIRSSTISYNNVLFSAIAQREQLQGAHATSSSGGCGYVQDDHNNCRSSVTEPGAKNSNADKTCAYLEEHPLPSVLRPLLPQGSSP